MKKKKESKKRMTSFNIWKGTTILLLGFLLGGGLYLVNLARQKQEVPVVPPQELVLSPEDNILALTTNKEKVNKLIDHYLKEYLSNNKVKYEFYLESQALLKGNFQLLGYPMSFYLYFEPFVLENGDIQLKAQSLSIGALGIPMNEVLKYIKRYFDFPKWIEINSKNSEILLHLRELKLSGNLKVRAEKIDLIQDEIKLSLYLNDGQNANQETEKKDEDK